MTKPRKFAMVLGLIMLIIFSVLTWYKFQYSMDFVKTYRIIVPQAEHKLLIATQGSAYKNAVVKGIITAAKERLMTVEVIDVSLLSTVSFKDWSAIIVIHTWENWQPQVDAIQFAQLHPNTDNIVFLSTSGQGDLKIPGVDAITSASLLNDVPKHVAEIVHRIDAVLMISPNK